MRKTYKSGQTHIPVTTTDLLASLAADLAAIRDVLPMDPDSSERSWVLVHLGSAEIALSSLLQRLERENP